MNTRNQPAWWWALKTLSQSLIPLWFFLSSILLVLATSPWWVEIEYRMAGFPPDSYGFSQAERIEWSSVDLRYLLNNADISYFDDYRFADGTPMHNDRELQHMDDVKNLIRLAITVFWSLTPLMIVLGYLLWKVEGKDAILLSLQVGAKTTLVLIAALIIGVALSFRVVFVGFHRIFFEGDTWLFRYSDTFIRLYPERFWRDTFILMGGTAVLLSALTFWIARRSRKAN